MNTLQGLEMVHHWQEDYAADLMCTDSVKQDNKNNLKSRIKQDSGVGMILSKLSMIGKHFFLFSWPLHVNTLLGFS